MARAGLMRERLIFQAKTETITASRVVKADWSEQFARWGRVKQEDGRAGEADVGARPMQQVRVTMIVRYDPQITSEMRVLWRGRIFEIEGILNRDERRRTLDLMMIERKAA